MKKASMSEGTEPRLTVQNVATRVQVKESMANSNPKGWSKDTYSGVKGAPKVVIKQGGYSYKG